MSEPKFTSGEWFVHTMDPTIVIIPGGGFDLVNIPDAKANAHLIASAPAMYAKLEQHIAAWENLYPSDVSSVDDMHMAEFQAIHKLIDSTKELLKSVRGE